LRTEEYISRLKKIIGYEITDVSGEPTLQTLDSVIFISYHVNITVRVGGRLRYLRLRLRHLSLRATARVR
jgi:hypothetical protein